MNSFDKYLRDMEDNNENKLVLRVCAKMCNECPFSNQSLKGWLGTHSIEDILNASRMELLFSCHKHRLSDENENKALIEKGEQPICKGFLLSAYKSCKQFGGNPITGKALKKLVDGMEKSPEELNKVLTTWEFKEYHQISVNIKNKNHV